MRGHDLPVVLRHGNGNDLVGTAEKGKKRSGHIFRSRVELSEGQGLSGVRNLQGHEMRKLLGGATEDLGEPPNSFLMRYARDAVAVKDVRQTVFADVFLIVDYIRRPNVSPPSHNREQKEKCENGCNNNRCQDLSSRARKSRCPSCQTRLRLDFKRESCSFAIIQNPPRLVEISLAAR